MNKTVLVFIGILLVILAALVFRKQRRDGIVEDANHASVALVAAGDEVRFELKYESCPPENSAVYAEWTRRLADAKVSSSRATELLGSDDPDAQLLSATIVNQEILLAERRGTCLKRQLKLLDAIRAGRRR